MNNIIEIGVNHKLLGQISIALQLKRPAICTNHRMYNVISLELAYPSGNLEDQIRFNYVNVFRSVGEVLLHGTFDEMGLVKQSTSQDSRENLELHRIYRKQYGCDPDSKWIDNENPVYDYDSCLEECAQFCVKMLKNKKPRLGLWRYYYGLGVIEYPVSSLNFVGKQ